MQTRFALSHKRDARMALFCVWYESCKNCCLPHLRFLKSPPTIGMGQNKTDILFDEPPQIPSVDVSSLNIARRTPKQVFEEIGEDVDNRFIQRKRRKLVFDELRRVSFGT